jgi:hypothetical protein
MADARAVKASSTMSVGRLQEPQQVEQSRLSATYKIKSSNRLSR